MFKNNPVERILGFLDETTSPMENLALMASLPAWLFVRAWFELNVLRRVYGPMTKGEAPRRRDEGRRTNSDFVIRP
jgi:hypothetical protein